MSGLQHIHGYNSQRSYPAQAINTNQLEVGKVYFVPDAHFVPPTSIIHGQKRQDGFFSHPCLVVNLVEDKWAEFYALTSKSPKAVQDLEMYLTMGSTSEDQGPRVLRLDRGSSTMSDGTVVNLEQRFKIEKEYLGAWMVNVQIDLGEIVKINTRVDELEAMQNRYIYKPIKRNLSSAGPGTVLLLLNTHPGSTFGAPILVLNNDGYRVHYFRIKRVRDNEALQGPENLNNHYQRMKCLLMVKQPTFGHNGTPELLFKGDSAEMREPSYVEISNRISNRPLDQMRTWCFPHVQLTQHSVDVILQYIRNYVQIPFAVPPPRTPFNYTAPISRRPNNQGALMRQPLQRLNNYPFNPWPSQFMPPHGQQYVQAPIPYGPHPYNTPHYPPPHPLLSPGHAIPAPPVPMGLHNSDMQNQVAYPGSVGPWYLPSGSDDGTNEQENGFWHSG